MKGMKRRKDEGGDEKGKEGGEVMGSDE